MHEDPEALPSTNTPATTQRLEVIPWFLLLSGVGLRRMHVTSLRWDSHFPLTILMQSTPLLLLPCLPGSLATWNTTWLLMLTPLASANSLLPPFLSLTYTKVVLVLKPWRIW